jgi:hypothetical protein
VPKSFTGTSRIQALPIHANFLVGARIWDLHALEW